jgi:hypothetical protein
MRIALRATILMGLVLRGGASAHADAPFPDKTERVMGVARVWATVKFFHPYLQYKDIDWDAALLAAIPRAEAATTTASYHAAVNNMLATLHDPLTHVIEPSTQLTLSTKPPADWLTWLTPTILKVKLAGFVGNEPTAAKRVLTEAAKAKVMVIDTRGFSSDVALELLEDVLPAIDEWPTERVVEHHGFRTQVGTTSGGSTRPS